MFLFKKWFTNAEDQTLAQTLAAEMVKDISPQLTLNRVQVLSVNKTTRILERVLTKATDYQVTQRMGWVRRARFANSLQWALRDLGYSQEFVSLVTEGLLVHSTKSASSPPKA